GIAVGIQSPLDAADQDTRSGDLVGDQAVALRRLPEFQPDPARNDLAQVAVRCPWGTRRGIADPVDLDAGDLGGELPDRALDGELHRERGGRAPVTASLHAQPDHAAVGVRVDDLDVAAVGAEIGTDLHEGLLDAAAQVLRVEPVQHQQARHQLIVGELLQQLLGGRALLAHDGEDALQTAGVQIEHDAQELFDALPCRRARHRAHLFEQALDAAPGLAKVPARSRWRHAERLHALRASLSDAMHRSTPT